MSFNEEGPQKVYEALRPHIGEIMCTRSGHSPFGGLKSLSVALWEYGQRYATYSLTFATPVKGMSLRTLKLAFVVSGAKEDCR